MKYILFLILGEIIYLLACHVPNRSMIAYIQNVKNRNLVENFPFVIWWKIGCYIFPRKYWAHNCTWNHEKILSLGIENVVLSMTLTTSFLYKHYVEQHMKIMLCCVVELNHQITLRFFCRRWGNFSQFHHIYHIVFYSVLNHYLIIYNVNMIVSGQIIYLLCLF